MDSIANRKDTRGMKARLYNVAAYVAIITGGLSMAAATYNGIRYVRYS